MKSLHQKAADFAKERHSGHKRKYTGLDYFTHLESVASIVASHNGTTEQVAAAYLHDVVENTDTDISEVECFFGPIVAKYVLWMTDCSNPMHGNRKIRKAIDRNVMALAPSEVHTIKLADLMDNTADIFENDKNFARVYIEEIMLLLPRLQSGNKDLYNLVEKQLIDIKSKLQIK